MWWYRDRTDPDAEVDETQQGPAVLAGALRTAVEGRPRELAALLAMSVLIDHRIEFQDGSIAEGPSWFEAERCVEEAIGADRPMRLYNSFSRDMGDGYSMKDDLPAEHRSLLDAILATLREAPGISAVGPRSADPE